MNRCRLFPRHQWGWVKNVLTHQVGLRSVRVTKRGVYRCDCGESKYGPCRIPKATGAQP